MTVLKNVLSRTLKIKEKPIIIKLIVLILSRHSFVLEKNWMIWAKHGCRKILFNWRLIYANCYSNQLIPSNIWKHIIFHYNMEYLNYIFFSSWIKLPCLTVFLKNPPYICHNCHITFPLLEYSPFLIFLQDASICSIVKENRMSCILQLKQFIFLKKITLDLDSNLLARLELHLCYILSPLNQNLVPSSLLNQTLMAGLKIDILSGSALEESSHKILRMN